MSATAVAGGAVRLASLAELPPQCKMTAVQV